jgi:hypothetical protein
MNERFRRIEVQRRTVGRGSEQAGVNTLLISVWVAGYAVVLVVFRAAKAAERLLSNHRSSARREPGA